jgi:hypothetical protein
MWATPYLPHMGLGCYTISVSDTEILKERK